MAGGQRRSERLRERLPRERRVERLEPARGQHQQRRRVGAAPLCEGQPRTQTIGEGELELVQRAECGDREQAERGVGRARVVLGLRRRERAFRAPRGVGGQRRGALQERRGGGQSAARMRAARRALELGGDVLVRACRRLRAMPGAAVGVVLRVRGVGERTVHRPPLLCRRPAVDRGAHERVEELDARLEPEQVGGLGRRGGAGIDAQSCAGAPEQRRIARRLRRRGEHELARVGGQGREALAEARLDAAREGRGQQREATGELGSRQPARELQQGQRVARGLGEDAVAYALVERSAHDRVQQRAGILVAQTLDDELRQARQLADRSARGQDERH